jgi:hypothetical protein
MARPGGQPREPGGPVVQIVLQGLTPPHRFGGLFGLVSEDSPIDPITTRPITTARSCVMRHLGVGSQQWTSNWVSMSIDLLR